jgi:RNA polymerase sigma-70 factor (ECF subfamily)
MTPCRDGHGWDWAAARERSARLARSYAASAEECDDIAQEAMLRAWRMRHTCRTNDAPWPWMAQITRNEALRRYARARETPLDPSDPFESAAEDPHLLTAPERADLQCALAALDPLDRVLVELRYRRDLTNPRIADLLEIPEGTVRVRLHRLRNALREVLEPA